MLFELFARTKFSLWGWPRWHSWYLHRTSLRGHFLTHFSPPFPQWSLRPHHRRCILPLLLRSLRTSPGTNPPHHLHLPENILIRGNDETIHFIFTVRVFDTPKSESFSPCLVHFSRANHKHALTNWWKSLDQSKSHSQTPDEKFFFCINGQFNFYFLILKIKKKHFVWSHLKIAGLSAQPAVRKAFTRRGGVWLTKYCL